MNESQPVEEMVESPCRSTKDPFFISVIYPPADQGDPRLFPGMTNFDATGSNLQGHTLEDAETLA
jgi:hypothetical protein